MSDSSASLVTLDDGQRISVSSANLYISEWNLRKRDIKDKQWEDWLDSLKNRGQEKAITISAEPIMIEGTEYYEIVDGQLRFLGMSDINEGTFFMDCEAKVFEDETDMIAYSIHTHQGRRDLSFGDYRWAIEWLIEKHNSLDDVAKVISKSRWWIQGILATRSYAEEIKQEIDQAQIDPSAQREIAKIFEGREKQITKDTVKDVSKATTRQLKKARKLVEDDGMEPDEAIKKVMERPVEPSPTKVPSTKKEANGIADEGVAEPSDLVDTKLDDFSDEEIETLPAREQFIQMDDTWVPADSKLQLSPKAYNMVNSLAQNHGVKFNEALNMMILCYK